MSARTRTIILCVTAALLVAAVVLCGYLIVQERAAGSGRAAIPMVAPSTSGQPTETASPSATPTREHWMVAMLRRKVVVYKRPKAAGAFIKTYLPARDKVHNVQTVCLVRRVKQTPGKIWYNVWLPTGPNGARGWIAEGGVKTYTVSTKIVIDLSARQLTVINGDGSVEGQYSCAIGTPALPTPKGHFFVTTRIQPKHTTGGFGAYVLAISAYSPQLAGTAEWGDAQVAIHGTNDPSCIGKAVSHGCIRLRNEDILQVKDHVEAGSPVIIKP